MFFFLLFFVIFLTGKAESNSSNVPSDGLLLYLVEESKLKQKFLYLQFSVFCQIRFFRRWDGFTFSVGIMKRIFRRECKIDVSMLFLCYNMRNSLVTRTNK